MEFRQAGTIVRQGGPTGAEGYQLVWAPLRTPPNIGTLLGHFFPSFSKAYISYSYTSFLFQSHFASAYSLFRLVISNSKKDFIAFHRVHFYSPLLRQMKGRSTCSALPPSPESLLKLFTFSPFLTNLPGRQLLSVSQ